MYVPRFVQVLLVAAALAFPLGCLAAEEVSFETYDGFRLVGDFYDAGPGSPTVLLLHQLGSDRSECLALALMLSRNGMNALAYDARGHGDSVMKNGVAVTWQEFDEGLFADMTYDIEAAVSYLEDRLGERGMGVGLAGASIQSSTALVYASRSSRVKALVMLSPGLYYKGIGTERPMGEYGGRPVFLAAGTGDRESYEALNVLKGLAGKEAVVVEVQGDAHGMGLINAAPNFILKLEDWLARNMKKGQD